MNSSAPVPGGTPQRSGAERLAPYLLGALVLLQALTTAMTLRYYPDGFWTENFYHPLAVNLLEHGAYGFGQAPNIEPSTFRPPLYATVLAGLYAVFGASEVVGVIFNNILLTLTVVLTYLIGRRFSPLVGVLAAAALVLDSIYLAEANRNQSDMLFTALVVLGLYAAQRACDRPLSLAWAAAAGLSFALATFTRAAGMYIWPMLVILLAVVHWRHAPRGRLLAAAALVAAVNAAFILPWMARNSSITGNSDFAGMKGYHIAFFYAPQFIAKRDGISYAEAKRRISQGFEESIAGRQTTAGERELLLKEYGSRLVRENLADALLVLPANIPRMFFSYASESIAVLLGPSQFEAWRQRYEEDHTAGNTPVRGDGLAGLLRYYVETGLIVIIAYGALVKALTIGVLVLGGAGCLRLLFSRDPRAFSLGLCIFLIIGLLTATSILATQGRFRLPVMPGLAVVAALTLVQGWTWWRARRALPGAA